MQKVTPLVHPALYTALSYLYVDNVPPVRGGVPEEFALADHWDLARLDKALSVLSGGPLSSGVWAWQPGAELDSEMWHMVCPEDGDYTALKERYPQHAADFDYVSEMLNSCFDGEDSEHWVPGL